jgi:proton-dependent oligopeptide transporter, POT family
MSQASESALAEGAAVPLKDEVPPTFWEQVAGFRRPFWVANVMEMIERLAYYGVRMVVPIYIASSEDPGGLHFTNVQKGTIFTAWALVQCFVPMFTGGFADRYGRKSTIAISIAIKIAGYILMAIERSYGGFLFGCLTLALGTAVFKPGVQGTLLLGTTPKNSSVGWGIFYQVVNIGGFLGPPLAGYLHHLAWKWVFFTCAGIVSINFLTLFTYDDTQADARSAEGATEKAPRELTQGSALDVLWYSVRKFFRPRLLAFIFIMSGFYVMFMQLYDMLPNYIEEWTDSSDVVRLLHLGEGLFARVSSDPVLSRGLQVPQEEMINLDSGAIILLMLPIAYLTAKFRRLSVIVGGILIAAAGLLLCGVSQSGLVCISGILLFAVGEMSSVPKMQEYLGVVAPKGEEALYMGYANMPFAVGWTLADYIGGIAYDRMADKANLALRYLTDHGLAPAEVVAKMPRTDAFKALMQATHTNATEATTLLWNAYHPYTVWYGFVAAGVVTAAGMLAFGQFAKRWARENA